MIYPSPLRVGAGLDIERFKMENSKSVLMYVTRSQVERAYKELQREPNRGGYIMSAELVESDPNDNLKKYEVIEQLEFEIEK